MDYHYHGGYGGYGYGPSYYGGYGYPYSSYYGGYYGGYGYPYYYAPRPPYRPPHDDDDNRPPPVRNPVGRYPGYERPRSEIDGRNITGRTTVYGNGRVTGDAPPPAYGQSIPRPQGRAPAGGLRGGDAYSGTRPVGRIQRPAAMPGRPAAVPEQRQRAPAPMPQGRQGGGRGSFESRRPESMSRPSPPARVSAPAPSAERARSSEMPRGRRDP